MAEYMDYNDVESASFQTKKQRWRTRIVVSISALFLIAAAVFAIVRTPQNVRTRFDAVTGERHALNVAEDITQNEFYRLNLAFEDEQTFAPNEEFQKLYPSVYELLELSSTELAAGRVYSFDSLGALTLCYPYITEQQATQDAGAQGGSIIGIDMTIIPYSADGSASFFAPIRFSLRYYNRQNDVPTIAGVYIPNDRFRLNFYSITLNFYGSNELAALSVDMKLADAVTKQEASADSFSSKLSFVGLDRAERTRSVCSSGDFAVQYDYKIHDPSESLSLKVSFDDLMYRKFSSISALCEGADEFSITVN